MKFIFWCTLITDFVIFGVIIVGESPVWNSSFLASCYFGAAVIIVQLVGLSFLIPCYLVEQLIVGTSFVEVIIYYSWRIASVEFIIFGGMLFGAVVAIAIVGVTSWWFHHFWHHVIILVVLFWNLCWLLCFFAS
ncbi:hypothetical protein F8M41_007284 [Gigaspora margarita]|uniref:Uncharacterized protein n=1 Tax=Gigaspora margarita TaxID=4874 RepID=A0A8H4AWC4_GIGMA|nr:hypothetical protein F8M41_007284 [Gigaspora margarita]